MKFSIHSKVAKYFCQIALVFGIAIIPVFGSLNASCNVHGVGTSNTNTGYFTPGKRLGQTFTACETGEVTQVQFDFSQVGTNTDLEFRISASPLSPAGVLGGAAYETVNIPTSGAQTLTINLSTPFPVNIGDTYAMEILTVSGGVRSKTATDGGGDYSEGGHYNFYNGKFHNHTDGIDLDFGVEIAGSQPPEPTIPTMSQWALIILGLILTSFAVVSLRRVALA